MSVWPALIRLCHASAHFLAAGLVVAGSYPARFADRAVEARPEAQAATLEPANDLRASTTVAA
jgi:hypothetical protein